MVKVHNYDCAVIFDIIEKKNKIFIVLLWRHLKNLYYDKNRIFKKQLDFFILQLVGFPFIYLFLSIIFSFFRKGETERRNKWNWYIFICVFHI